MKTTIKKTALKDGWLLSDSRSLAKRHTQVVPATEPRNLSNDPAFGNFNLPLTDHGRCVVLHLAIEDADDIASLRDAIDAGDFESYSDFRRDELGL